MNDLLKHHILVALENNPLLISELHDRLRFVFELQFDLALDYLLMKEQIKIVDQTVALSQKE
jgi:hypothetical protein